MRNNKFVLIDPSFMDRGGDKWQYAVTFAKSAHASGYEFILLTNISAPKIGPALDFNIQQRNVLRRTFYDHDKIVERDNHSSGASFRRRLDARCLEERDQLDQAIEASNRNGSALRARWDQARRAVLDAKQLALAMIALIGERFFDPPILPFNRDDDAIALAEEIQRLRLVAGDRLFFHTVTPAMMESLSEITVKLGLTPPIDVDAYFLFHFGSDAPDARTFLDRHYSFSHSATLKLRLSVGAPFKRIHLLATSEELRDELHTQFGMTASVFHGLTDYAHYIRANGGDEQARNTRDTVHRELLAGRVRLLLRASDLDQESARAVARAAHLVQHRGFSVDLRIIYHSGSVARLREILSTIDFPFVSLKNTDENDEYIREINAATLVLLTYDALKYAKRVSAVLHDCAVLGVPAVVPSGTTLSEAENYATIFIYNNFSDILGTVLNAVRALARNNDMGSRNSDVARRLYATDVVHRLLGACSTPSLVIPNRGPVANVLQPLWGRCGSSHAFEAQTRYLMSRGYFVNQIFVADKPLRLSAVRSHFWQMLRENSEMGRGNVQRIAFVEERKRAIGRWGRRYLSADALTQLVVRIGRSRLYDSSVEKLAARARITIVNHVFNSEWAKKYAGGRRVLETHDIQSYQAVKWPLRNDADNRPEAINKLLAGEAKLIAKFDHVINCSPEEHMIISEFNANSTLITPFVPPISATSSYKAVAEMGAALGWHESYAYVSQFDMLIVGDSHLANVESVIWFIENVFRPKLQHLGFSLALCGRLSDAVYERLGGIGYVYFVGFVRDLGSVRALSKLAILPDQRGTGVSVKTLEAFASNMPFVGTRAAFRGITHLLPEGMPVHDSPDELASAIRRALNDPSRLLELAELSKECYRRTASVEVWEGKWDQVLHRLSIAPGRSFQ